MKVGIIILAAGESKRMGVPKQLLDINGISMLKGVVKEAICCDTELVTVVTGAYHLAIVKELEGLAINIIENVNWKSGIASSIKIGLVGSYALKEDFDALIIMASDMPAVKKSILDHLISAAGKTKKPIIASKYNDSLGIPVLFKKCVFDQLLDLKGDIGAKQLFSNNLKDIDSIRIGNAGIDLDTKEEYFRYLTEDN